jgi:hypothetical protein
LRRTLHLPVLCSAIITISFFACRNHSSSQEEIVRAFDSINNVLKKTDSLLYPSSREYDTLLAKAWDNSETQQMHYTINDFQAYISNLRTLFKGFIGDSVNVAASKGDDVLLTRAFFKKGENTTGILYGQLTDVISALRSQPADAVTIEKIGHFEANTIGHFPSSEKLLTAFFHDTPPVAVITILNSFEQTVKDITVYVLRGYFKNH